MQKSNEKEVLFRSFFLQRKQKSKRERFSTLGLTPQGQGIRQGGRKVVKEIDNLLLVAPDHGQD